MEVPLGFRRMAAGEVMNYPCFGADPQNRHFLLLHRGFYGNTVPAELDRPDSFIIEPRGPYAIERWEGEVWPDGPQINEPKYILLCV